jgi:hypothetical protein
MFGYEEQAPFHDAAQICLNGHVINDSSHWSPEFNQKFCSKCGEATTTSCPECGAEIRGRYHAPGVVVLGAQFPAPSYCANCGHSYPWTERRLKAAKALADEFEELNEGERDKLKESLDDLVRDSPQTGGRNALQKDCVEAW